MLPLESGPEIESRLPIPSIARSGTHAVATESGVTKNQIIVCAVVFGLITAVALTVFAALLVLPFVAPAGAIGTVGMYFLFQGVIGAGAATLFFGMFFGCSLYSLTGDKLAASS